MSNDNDPRDDAMREIEAALDDYAEACVQEFRSGVIADVRKAVEAKNVALALIRSKLPQPEAEHERAVEAWRGAMCRAIERLTKHANKRGEEAQFFGELFGPVKEMSDEALRLMRARPQPAPHFADRVKIRSAIDECRKDEAAGELLRAAKEAWPWVYGHPRQSDELWQAIAKAERAGIKP